MFQVKINRVEYSSDCSDFSIDGNDLDSSNSNRDEAGYLHRDRIRPDVHAVPYIFNNLPRGVGAQIKVALSDPIITMSYPDLEGVVTKTGYVSKLSRKCTAWSGDGAYDSYWTLEFTFVEQ